VASILVIDDNRAVLATIKILLEHNGYAVETIDNGQAGLRLFEAGAFDLLIVDIFMPGMDGFETMSLAHRARPKTPIVVMSGQEFRSAAEGAPDFLHMATKLGAVRTVQKPFRAADLLAVVAASLSGSRK
jgi:CheY-like chemotaxis protein